VSYKDGRKYTMVSLFSGGMGLDLGLERTGRFRLLAVVEKEPAYCETARLNQARGRLGAQVAVYEDDISAMDPAEILKRAGLKPGELDLLVGGPPCQSFSTAGRRGTVQDPRGTLLWHFLRFVEVMRPKMFLMENVRGLLSAALRHRPISERPENGGAPLAPSERPGSVVRLFASDLRKIAGAPYHMDCFEVNAVNYGAPQIRERALFIGDRYNQSVDFPQPTYGITPVRAPELDIFDPKPGLPLIPWATLRDAIGDLRENSPELMDFSPRKKRYLSLVPPGSNWRSLPEEIQKESMGRAWHAKGGRSGWWRRLSFDLPSPTLVTMPNHASTALCHPVETRALSVREYARIQEFPDDWAFAGRTVDKYAQIGNAVPVRLGEIAGQTLARALDQLNTNGWKVSSQVPREFSVIYLQSHVRTRQWYRDGQVISWDDGGENETAAYSAPKTLRKVRQIEGRR
jgi:DNA (cytosine-5)-methyltransferase 1